MWTRPGFTNEVALAAYYAVAYILFDISITFVAMPYFALTPELTSNYDERTDLTTYRMAFSILGSLIAFTVPLLIIGSFRPENADRVLLMAVVFGLVSTIPLLTVFFSTKERKEYQDQPQPKFKDALKSAIQNRPFIFSTIIYLATWVSVDILQTTLLFFIKYIVQQESQSDYIMGAIFITAIFALPLWDWASRKWNKRVAYAIGIAFWAVVQILMISLGSTSTLTMIYGMCILAGIGVSAAHVLPWAMIPDAIEYDEWKTGARHEGMFYSLVTLAQKIASSLAVPGVLLILELTGYVPNAATQPDSALLGIRLAIGPIPAVLLVIGILFAVLYPLNREKHAQMVRELEERRNQAAENVNG
jgi:GPH family glycoside/pentoside/hexuronide:cation symporter